MADEKKSSLVLEDNRDFVSSISSEAGISSSVTNEKINNEWILKIKESVPYIDKIFADPKRFIKTEEEILNIEKIKKVSTESVKHLVKHADFVDEFDPTTGYVRPSKILNVFKEDTFNTYENRFIFTLVEYIATFLDIMERKIRTLSDSLSDKFEYKSRSDINGETVDYKFQISAFKEINRTDDTLEDILYCKRFLLGWKQSELYKTLQKERVVRVTSPIKRTNVILKNPNFQIAAKLWDYLHKYQYILDDEVVPRMDLNDIPDDFKKRMENTFLSNYYIMKILTAKDSEESNDYRKKLDDINYLLLKSTIDSIISSDDSITKEKILSVISDQFDSIKEVKVTDTSVIEKEMKDLASSYVSKVDSICFEVGDDIL